METDYTITSGCGPGNVAPMRENLFKRVSWGAIFAGVIVSMVIMLAMGLLGMGIGLGVVNPTEPNAFSGVGIGAGIWFGLSTLLALFAGGWAAGKLAGYPRKMIGSLHGVVVWGLASLFSFYIMTTTLGMVVSGVTGVLGQGLSAIASGAQSIGPQAMQFAQRQIQDRGISVDQIMGQAQQAMGQMSDQEKDQFRQSLQRYLGNPQGPQSAQDREYLISTLSNRGNMSREQAAGTVDKMASTYQQGQQQLEQAKGAIAEKSESVMNAVSAAAIWAFVAMIIGAVAAALGGMLGSPRREEVPVT